MEVFIKEENITIKELEKIYESSKEPKVLFEVSKEEDNFIYVGLEAEFYIVCKGNKVFIADKNLKYEEISVCAFEFINDLLSSYKSKEERFPFIGGFLGYVSYDMVKFFEKKLKLLNRDEINTPDMIMGFYTKLFIYDKVLGKTFSINLNEESADEIKLILEATSSTNATTKAKSRFDLDSNRNSFCEKVTKAKEYINAGDIFQVVLSNRMKIKTGKNSFEIYRSLNEVNKSKYMYCLNYSNFSVIGSSPEVLVSLQDRKCITNPIAGTVKRCPDKTIENRRIQNLLVDKKELAEHNMLVDLGRNDLGRVCEFGSVEVAEYMKIEKFSHVIHMSSTVIGDLKDTCNAVALLQSVLPVGTVSGAPKVRAMEIIEELEDCKRGIYSGGVGYFSLNGNMDFAIAIRTIVKKEDTVYIQAGAGIVYDSVPEKEYEETINKMKVLMEVL